MIEEGDEKMGNVFPNWKQICLIPDPLFRVAVGLAFARKQSYILKGLQKGFPELFSQEPTPIQVPASALKAAARERSREEGYNQQEYGAFDAELWLPTDDFDLPWVSLGEDEVPEYVWKQMIGQAFEFGLSVEYEGVRYLVASIDDNVAKLHETVTENDVLKTTHLNLVPFELVDMEA